jgi:alkylation response protein AidB-like acyl-CoA dehydrogenase
MVTELDPSLTPEVRALRDAAHEFATATLRPAAAALDRLTERSEARSPLWHAFRQAYRRGYHRALLPAEVGGLGLDALGQHVLFEELGWGAADLAIGIAAASLPFVMAASTGNPDLVDQFVRPFVEDSEGRTIGCWALTEPEHGSDSLLVGTPQFDDPRISAGVIARRDRDHYVLNGRKAAWVVNGTIATHALVFVGMAPGRGMAGGGVALVPLHLRGVSRGEPADLMGQRGLDQGEIVFDEVRIPEAQLLTDPTLYEFMLARTLALTCTVTAAVFTGAARAAWEAGLAQSRERVQGGKPIAEHQLVQKRLFDMFTRVEACRALSRAAMVHGYTAGPPGIEHAIAAKVFCTEGALAVADGAVQLLGARGLARGCPAEKMLRDARASLVENGANEVLALVGARRLLGRAGPHMR